MKLVKYRRNLSIRNHWTLCTILKLEWYWIGYIPTLLKRVRYVFSIKIEKEFVTIFFIFAKEIGNFQLQLINHEKTSN